MKSKENPNNTTLDTDYTKEIINLLKKAAYSKSVSQVFNDFLEMGAIAIANTVDFTHREEREKRYLELINSYDKRHQDLFPEMLAQLVLALDEKAQTTGAEDILGIIFHDLELHSVYSGQFFTPPHISDFMASITCGETIPNIEERGYITVCEPCCGSGVMITSFCKAMKENNLDYQRQLVVTAVDIDLKCVHMTYLQLALYGVPAVVIHGNSLTCEEFSRWYTPVYILHGWIWRRQCGIATTFCVEDEMIKRGLDPMYAAFRQIEALTPTDAESTESVELAENPVEKIVATEKISHTVKLREFGEQINLFDDGE